MSCVHGRADACPACIDLAVYIRTRVPSVQGPATRHLCRSCGKVKWIECRGHRAWGETRTHFQVEVLEQRTRNVYYAGTRTTVRQTYVASAATACKRTSRDVTDDWRKVECLRCLKARPA